MRMPCDELQEAITSTQFIKYVKVLNDRDYFQHSKTDHQLAQIAFEIYQIKRFLGGKGVPKAEYDDYLVKFKGGDNGEQVTDSSVQTEKTFDNPGCPGIEVGVDPLDEKWKAVNEKAKAIWGAFLDKIGGR